MDERKVGYDSYKTIMDFCMKKTGSASFCRLVPVVKADFLLHLNIAGRDVFRLDLARYRWLV